MKKLIGLAAVAAMMWAAPAFACDKDKATAAGKASGCHGKEAQTASAKQGCHGDAGAIAAKVMEKLPALSYRVADFSTPCPHAAAEKAGVDGKIQYVVDGKSYDCKGQATAALAGLLEKEAADMMTVRYAVGEDSFGCPMAARDAAAEKKGEIRYRLAGLNFKSQEEADKVAKLVSETVAKMAQSEPGAQATGATGGCSKMKAAETASATGGCGKAKAETASVSGAGCCAKSRAVTASATDGRSEPGAPATGQSASGCSKAKAETASATGGCSKAQAQTASATDCCRSKGAVAGEDCCAEAEKRVASAKAKLQVIIETVLASSKS